MLFRHAARSGTRVTGRTRAVIPVHLFGLCADIGAVRAALPSGIAIVEDAACAAGAALGNAPAGAQPAGIRVWKIDTAFKHVTAHSTDALGTGTGSIQVNPLNGQVYLTAYSGQVSVLDPENLKLLRQFTAPDTPDGLFFGRLK